MKELRESIDRLIDFARQRLGLSDRNVDCVRNRVLDLLGMAFEQTGATAHGEIAELLADFSAQAVKAGIIVSGDEERYEDAVMGELSLLPQALQEKFYSTEKQHGSAAATDMFYGYCVDNNYVKKAKLDNNPRFESDGIIITINKAKPEYRDAKKAAAGNAVDGGYPSCSICHENEGFGGRTKRTLRTVDIMLGGQRWFWQYSPYGYFYQHGIAVNYEHTPMHVDGQTFGRLMDFVDRFPHYFIGCNAALPRIGGSVLAHDHYQGGGELLPMHKAGALHSFRDRSTGAVVEVVDWPCTVVRAVSANRKDIESISERVRAAWVDFDAPELGIIHADSDGIHNAVSPSVVKTARGYEMNIILRSNITSDEFPDGVFHAHPEFHSVKKESIGLIEAQGLFILPGRLEKELGELSDCIVRGEELPNHLLGHKFIFREIKELCKGKRDKNTVEQAVKRELGSVCKRILGNIAVFKNSEITVRFLKDKVLDK